MKVPSFNSLYSGALSINNPNTVKDIIGTIKIKAAINDIAFSVS